MKSILLASAALIALSTSAQAATVTPTAISASVNISGSGGSASDSQNSLPVATASGSVGGDDPIDATATQNADGSSFIQIDNAHIGWSGSPILNTATATTSYTVDLTNDGPLAVYGYFSFDLKNIELETFNAGGSAPTASVSVSAVSAVDSFAGMATLTGTYNAATLSGSGISGPLVRSDCIGTTCYTTKMTGADITPAIYLGEIASGATTSVTVTMSAMVSFFGYELGAKAKIGDPFAAGPGYSVSFTPVTGPISAVPLPASVLLLMGGLAGLGALRRRQQG